MNMIRTQALRVSTLGIIALSCGLTLAAAPAARPATVADLTVRMATALGFEPAAPAEARRTLLRAGIDLGSDLDATLTRERAHDLLSQLGVATQSPADPKAPVSAGTVTLIALTAADALMATPGPVPMAPEPLDPTCFTLPLNECQSCCVHAAQQTTLWPRLLARLCAMNCQTLTVPPSPSVPN